MFQNPPPPTPSAPLPPAGAGLLLRALFKRGARTNDPPQLPPTVFACTAPGPEALARYNALLGFARDAQPVSAHYLLAQRAHLESMLAPAFPFRLPGMVHVENAIAEHARVAPGTPLRLVTQLRIDPPTASGARFCVLDTTAWDGSTAVFGCTSKYLALPGRRGGARSAPDPAPALPLFAGWDVGHDAGRAYARVSGDWNPIHLARPAARLFGLRGPIIHGMHSVAKALACLEAQGGRVRAVDVRFRSTVPLGAKVQMLHAPGTAAFALVCEGRLAVEGEVAFTPA